MDYLNQNQAVPVLKFKDLDPVELIKREKTVRKGPEKECKPTTLQAMILELCILGS